MPNNNILLFDENSLNMETDADYSSNTQRLNGVQAGIASSKLQNKFQRQVSVIAYAIAQIMNANGYDSLDSDAVSTFVNNLSSSIRQTKDLAKLKPGVEYLTDEIVTASDDSIKNIYVKRIEFVPTSFSPAARGYAFSVAHGITDLDEIIEIKDLFKTAISSFPNPDSPSIPIWVSFENSQIYTSANARSTFVDSTNVNFLQPTPSAPSDPVDLGFTSGFVILKYTKSV